MPRKRAHAGHTCLYSSVMLHRNGAGSGAAGTRCTLLQRVEKAGLSRHTRRAVPQTRCFDDCHPLLAAAATAAAIGAAP